ncbi:MAG: hypothetical protein RTU63_02080 [Candidatus Thorarchaeota archaeon]
MVGSMKSAIIYLLTMICMIGQLIASAAFFGDTIGAIAASGFVVIILIGAIFAWTGGLSAVQQKQYEYQSGPYTKTTVWKDTGQRVQCTPCFGIGGGLFAIVVVFMIGGDLVGTPLFVGLLPGTISGVLAVLAAIVFFLDYKGKYYDQV